jgi:hypothetical protein
MYIRGAFLEYIVDFEPKIWSHPYNCTCYQHEGSGPADLPGNWEKEQEEKP